MQTLGTSIFRYIRNLLMSQNGQNLVEYALVVGLLALGSAAVMESMTSAVDTVFSGVTSSLTTNV